MCAEKPNAMHNKLWNVTPNVTKKIFREMADYRIIGLDNMEYSKLGGVLIEIERDESLFPLVELPSNVIQFPTSRI